MIEAVVFDWGGTLSVYADIDIEDMWRLAARHMAPEREDELCARLVQVEAEAWADAAVDERSFTLAELLARASSAVGLDVAEAVLEEAAGHHLDSWTPHIRHDPDAAGVLQALVDRGLRIGLLSNTHWPRDFHEHFLARDGLAELIHTRVYTSGLPWSKPHPAAFGAVLDALGVDDPGRAVFVGDRPYDDVYGAKRAGLRGVLRRNRFMPAYDVVPDAEIDRLPELLDVVDGWA